MARGFSLSLLPPESMDNPCPPPSHPPEAQADFLSKGSSPCPPWWAEAPKSKIGSQLPLKGQSPSFHMTPLLKILTHKSLSHSASFSSDVLFFLNSVSKFFSKKFYLIFFGCPGSSLLWAILCDSMRASHCGGSSCLRVCGIFPDQGLNPCPLHWQVDS